MKKCGIRICLAFIFLSIGILKSSTETVSYWEARGDAAAAKKNSASALVSWMRAERAGGFSDRWRLVQKRLSLPAYAKDSPNNHAYRFALEVMRSILADIPLLFLQLGLLLALFFTAFFLGKMGFAWFLREKYLYAVALLILCGVTFIRKEVDDTAPGVLLKSQAVLTSGPSESFPVVTSLVGPDVVSVVETSNGYVKVAKDSLSGWISRDALEVV